MLISLKTDPFCSLSCISYSVILNASFLLFPPLELPSFLWMVFLLAPKVSIRLSPVASPPPYGSDIPTHQVPKAGWCEMDPTRLGDTSPTQAKTRVLSSTLCASFNSVPNLPKLCSLTFARTSSLSPVMKAPFNTSSSASQSGAEISLNCSPYSATTLGCRKLINTSYGFPKEEFWNCPNYACLKVSHDNHSVHASHCWNQFNAFPSEHIDAGTTFCSFGIWLISSTAQYDISIHMGLHQWSMAPQVSSFFPPVDPLLFYPFPCYILLPIPSSSLRSSTFLSKQAIPAEFLHNFFHWFLMCFSPCLSKSLVLV